MEPAHSVEPSPNKSLLSECWAEALDFHTYTKFYLTFNAHRVTLTM